MGGGGGGLTRGPCPKARQCLPSGLAPVSCLADFSRLRRRAKMRAMGATLARQVFLSFCLFFWVFFFGGGGVLIA